MSSLELVELDSRAYLLHLPYEVCQLSWEKRKGSAIMVRITYDTETAVDGKQGNHYLV